MVDVIAAFKLSAAASKIEALPNLTVDALILYRLYQKIQSGSFDLHQFAKSDELKPALVAAANLANVACDLSDDPDQFQNIRDLLTSLKETT